jgi:hypothetical protein
VLAGFNDLKTTHPDIAAEWDYEKNIIPGPEYVTKGCNATVFWICPLGHSYSAMVNSRTKGSGCPYCAGTTALAGFNDLITTHPDLAIEWDYVKNIIPGPEYVTKGCNKMISWICSSGHSYEASPNNRTHGKGCPYCAGKKILAGFNDLKTTHPNIAAEWDYEKNTIPGPEHITHGARTKVHWLCPLGHSYEASVNARTCNKGCPFCAGQKILVGFNDLKTLFPKKAAEWDYKKNTIPGPEYVTCKCDKMIWWICEHGHSFRAIVSSRTKKNSTGCPYCSGHKIIPGKNDLASQYPDIAAEWNYNKNHVHGPEYVHYGSERKVWWICPEGHEYYSSINARTNMGTGCPYCSGHKVLTHKR